ncbi:MAG: cytochrome b5 domain-containing protein [Candidatus Promineifilaceae bacterium]
MIPSRRILSEAEAENKRLGHENLGFLSESHGFMPTSQPLLSLPPGYQVWDEMAAQLPELFRHLTLRAELERMPLLSAADLPDIYLLRAAAIFGIFAHAYHYVQPEPYTAVPEPVQRPWAEISQRLQRPAPHLSFIDLNIYNWRLIDPQHPDPMCMENLALLIPILGNEDERRFQMTPTEMMARFTPALTACVRAQEAVATDDPDALQAELRLITDVLQQLTYDVLMKVNPNAYHPLYVNPVVWGKTVAPIATPFQETGDIPGPSGTAIPAFQLLDILFGRRAYRSSIGQETAHARRWFPPHWRAFLDAAETISVADYVSRVGDRALSGVFQTAVDAYAGEKGLLGRHRLKTFGFLDLSFKAGRSKTLGGFSGAFDDRMWDKMDGELEKARLERYASYPQVCHFVPVLGVADVRREGNAWVKGIRFDMRGSGLSCQPGDRCAILPENDPALVEQTLAALQAGGDEPVQLNAIWREGVKQRDGYQEARVLSLRTLLTFGRIRPISRPMAKRLYRLSHNEALWRILEARAEDQWELWDLLALLREGGFQPRRLWQAEPGDVEHICRLISPESFRMYSIASVERDEAGKLTEIGLLVGRLAYETPDTAVSPSQCRFGTASNYLARLAEPTTVTRRVAIKLVHPPRFRLPTDPQRPIVMFAGGTGLAPFLSLLEARAAQNSAENWLFFGTRTPQDLYAQDALETWAVEGNVHLQVAFSRTDVGMEVADGRFTFPPAPRGYIDTLMLQPGNARQLYHLLQSQAEGGLGATVYVCGHVDFARTVTDAIKKILAQYGGGAAQAQQMLYRLVGDDRYLLEVFTTYAGAQFAQKRAVPASEVVVRNNDKAGYWMIIDGRVYDLSEFAHLHPGGLKIVRSYAGMDATAAYSMVLHDVNSEVNALLGLYEIGVVRRLDLGQTWGAALSPEGLQFVTLQDVYRAWVRLLYQVVEMENALANDFSIRQEPVTYDEAIHRVSLSRYRLQQYLQSHARFRRDYQAKVIGDPLQQLWLLTGSLCDERATATWLQERLTAVKESAAARQFAAWETGLPVRLHDPNLNGHSLGELETACTRLEEADHAFMQAMKEALRYGVQLFEQYEAETLVHGCEELLTLMKRLPEVLEEYYGSAFQSDKV